MPQTFWQKPVKVAVGQMGTEDINGPSEALILLSDRWPDLRGPQFVRARSACRAALDGRRSAEDARRFFEDAVSEARIQVN